MNIEAYQRADNGIAEIMGKYPLGDKRKGIINLILWRVSSLCGNDVANALIQKHSLWYACEGSHAWFDDAETRGAYRPMLNPIPVLVEGVDYRYQTKNEVKKFERTVEFLLKKLDK